MSKISIAIAGSTQNTVQCALTLLESQQFDITWILTPVPKPIGRKQIITENPLHQFAKEHQVPVVLLEESIDTTVQTQIEELNARQSSDFLLVVDFGYIIPTWLLKLPKLASLNIHPSALPTWRGSSPGQFSLLYGDQESAVTLMIMDEGMDTGQIVIQIPFAVLPTWTQTEYYQESFSLICTQLSQVIQGLAEGKLHPKPQPITTPTPIARRLSREDGFVEWSFLKTLLEESCLTTSARAQMKFGATSPLLIEASQAHTDWASTIEHAVRAFTPWPLVWTVIPTNKGEKRMQILSVGKSEQQCLELQLVKLEGQNEAHWNQVRNSVVEE